MGNFIIQHELLTKAISLLVYQIFILPIHFYFLT